MGKTDQCTRILMATRHKFSTLAFRVHIWNQSVYFFWRKPLIPQPRVASTGHELHTTICKLSILHQDYQIRN